MGELADYYYELELLHELEYGPTDPMDWYEEKWEEEQYMRKMTLKEVLEQIHDNT